MRAFARPMALAGLSLEARILYTGFCLFMLLGVWSSAWLYDDDGIAFSGTEVVRHYRGDDALPLAPAQDGAMHFEKAPRQVMETFHFHLFSMPVVLLVIGHIFMMTSWSTRNKLVWLLLASAFTFLHVMAPLLVRFVSAASAPMFVGSAFGMLCSWSVLLATPLWQMWTRAPRAPAGT